MSFRFAHPWTGRRSRMTAIATFALVLAGCTATSAPGGSAAAPATPAPSGSAAAPATPGPSVAASAPAMSASPNVVIIVPSESAGPCVPAEIMAAIKEVARANFEPATPLDEVADALEALDYGGSLAAEIRDELVTELRDPNPTKTRQALVHVANVFLSRGGVTEC